MTAQALFDRAQPMQQGFRDVRPGDVATLRQTLRIIDVRQPAEYSGELGHIPGATLVPLATLPAAASGWDRHEPIVLVCRSGGRSSSAAAQLVAAGFTRVMNMRGGMLAYQAEGLPATR